MAKTTLLDTAQNGHVDWLDPADEQALYDIIAQSKDRPEELVEIPLWRVKVLVRAMSGTQRVLYESNSRDQKSGRFKDLRHVYFEVARLCCVHPRTKKPFLKSDQEHTFMDERNGAIIDLLAAKALRLSGLMGSQQEQIAKNSEATPVSMTISDSVSDSNTGE